MSERTLKPGWQLWRFDQMAVNVNDRIDNPAEAEEEYYVGLEHLDTDSLKIRRWGTPSDVEATKLRFRKGDIIFGRRRAYQRKLAVADFDGICSAHALVLRPKADVILPEFLPFFMQSALFMSRALEISVGSLSPTINWKTLASQEFALPPLEDQKISLDVLRKSFEMLEAYRDLFEIANLQYLSAVLYIYQNGTKGGKTAKRNNHCYPADWQLVRIDKCFNLQLGKMSSAKSREGTSHQQYLKNNNVLWGEFNFSELSSMYFDDAEQKKFSLSKGDLLVCEGGEIGRAAVWNNECPGLFYQKAIHRLRPKSGEYSTAFMVHYLRYCSLRGILDGISTGTTIKHLPAEKLAALILPFPQKNEQVEIANTLNATWDAVRLIQNRVVAALAKYNSLLDLILRNRDV